ncbi:NUDIX domain-containing protein [Actinokineospora inagensis]|uniref:NUDIX domain-containing protein n=1 Tax=Actinokineospora inagensis TaxID=103730 RepID=UPI00041CC746|nr:NUDIX hydrolase [Actinokineospora inagensis]
MAVIQTADAIVFAQRRGQWHVLLIERGKPPFQGRWALPGGKVNPGEDTLAAAIRELAEETGVRMPRTAGKVGVYDTPGRDPRGRYTTSAYAARLTMMPTPVAADDAKTARWVPLADIIGQQVALAFDHDRIVSDAMRALRIQLTPSPVRPEQVTRLVHLFTDVEALEADKRTPPDIARRARGLMEAAIRNSSREEVNAAFTRMRGTRR